MIFFLRKKTYNKNQKPPILIITNYRIIEFLKEDEKSLKIFASPLL